MKKQGFAIGPVTYSIIIVMAKEEKLKKPDFLSSTVHKTCYFGKK
jgi:hypothetical protein